MMQRNVQPGIILVLHNLFNIFIISQPQKLHYSYSAQNTVKNWYFYLSSVNSAEFFKQWNDVTSILYLK